MSRLTNSLKPAIIATADSLGSFAIGHRLRAMSLKNRYVRAVNYHRFSPETADGFRRQLTFYSRYFDNCTRDDLDDLLSGNQRIEAWKKPKLLISFDDGFVEHRTIAAPLLEEFGFIGWFFVPAWHIGRSLQQPNDKSGGLAGKFLSAQDLKDLRQRRHVVGCHTYYHTRLTSELSQDRLDMEIASSKAKMEEDLGEEVDIFCWVRGDEPSYSAAAHRTIKDSDYRLSFMTNLAPIMANTDPFCLQRTNIEADWPLASVRFYLSGLFDIAYAPKRKRVAQKLAAVEPVDEH